MSKQNANATTMPAEYELRAFTFDLIEKVNRDVK